MWITTSLHTCEKCHRRHFYVIRLTFYYIQSLQSLSTPPSLQLGLHNGCRGRHSRNTWCLIWPTEPLLLRIFRENKVFPPPAGIRSESTISHSCRGNVRSNVLHRFRWLDLFTISQLVRPEGVTFDVPDSTHKLQIRIMKSSDKRWESCRFEVSEDSN